MRALVAAVALAAGLGGPVQPEAARAAAWPADSLPSWLVRLVPASLARADWGIAVYDIGSRAWLVEHDADRLFVPASTLKLVVSAVGLERLGPGFRYTTSVYATAPVAPDGTVDGDLVLYGRGDPNLSGRHAPSMTTALEWLADSIAAAGIRRVTGDLVADESHWDADYVRGDWDAYDLRWWYAAPVAALGFNDNSVDLEIEPGPRVGSPPVVRGRPASRYWALENRATTGRRGTRSTFDLTRAPGTNRIIAYGSLPIDAEPAVEYFAVVDPAAYAATVLDEILASRGIEVDGVVRTLSSARLSSVAAGDTIRVGTHLSPPLESVVEAINGRSQNWHAEQLVKTLGREVGGEGSWRAGLAVERTTLAGLGLDTTAFVLRDGSGLSRGNLASPAALVELLVRARTRPWAEAFRASLPVAGRSGSLERRFVGGPAAGRVRAKTGFIAKVHALSGYLTTLDGDELAFSIVVNGANGRNAAAVEAIDRVVEALVAGEIP